MTLQKGLFIALPTYGGQRWNLMPIINMLTQQQSFQTLIPYESDISLLAMSFNRAWCEALKLRRTGAISHFLLMHADIKPLINKDQPSWLDTLYQAMASVGAEVMQSISPIKDHRGVTSCGLDDGDDWSPRRLTMKEVTKQQSDEFTHPQMIVNTGLLLIDMKRDWVKKICFTIRDCIRWATPTPENPDGDPFPAVQPEDWDFSRQCRALGVDVWATRRVKLVHRGVFDYPNFSAWGSYDVDRGDGPQEPEK